MISANHPISKFANKPQVTATVVASPFIIFTAILLTGSPALIDYMVFFNISYAAVLGTYVSGGFWGHKLAAWQTTPPAHENEMLEGQLFSYVAPLVAWISLIISYQALSLLLMIGIHSWFLSVYLRFKQDNKLPAFVAILKVHPFMISIPCLALNFVKAFFTCPTA